MEDTSKEIEQYIADTIMGRPYSFSVDDNGEAKLFSIFPVTLGKMLLLQRHIEALQLNGQILQKDVSLEALRLAKEKREECLSIICYHTCKDKEEFFNPSLIAERTKLLKRILSDEDIASLMIMVLTMDKTALFFKHLGIDKEQERLSVVMKVKEESDKNNIVFGGKSQFGALLDAACERYGWTKDYVVWGIDYASLRLMLADKVNSVYCSDDEMKRIPAWARGDGHFVKADDPKNKELIKSMSWK